MHYSTIHFRHSFSVLYAHVFALLRPNIPKVVEFRKCRHQITQIRDILLKDEIPTGRHGPDFGQSSLCVSHALCFRSTYVLYISEQVRNQSEARTSAKTS